MTASRIGRGAIVTLGAAASMAWAAGAANACDTPPAKSAPPTQDHHHHTKPPAKPKPDAVCQVTDDDVQYAELSSDGKTPVDGWHEATIGSFKGNTVEPQWGYQLRLNPDAVTATCTGTADVSLASYDTGGATWGSSGGAQHFVDYSHVQLSAKSPSQTITVKLPGTPGSKSCFGQIDLYFGTTVYDGGAGPGHGPLPDFNGHVSTPNPKTELITAWNGTDAGDCAVTPSSPPPPGGSTTPAPPATTPTTHPSTPVTSVTTPAPKPSTTPSTPPTTTATPGTPTLAHTGADAGEVSLVALAFFGAGGTAMFASRKAKTAGARKQ